MLQPTQTPKGNKVNEEQAYTVKNVHQPQCTHFKSKMCWISPLACASSEMAVFVVQQRIASTTVHGWLYRLHCMVINIMVAVVLVVLYWWLWWLYCSQCLYQSSHLSLTLYLPQEHLPQWLDTTPGWLKDLKFYLLELWVKHVVWTLPCCSWTDYSWCLDILISLTRVVAGAREVTEKMAVLWLCGPPRWIECCFMSVVWRQVWVCCLPFVSVFHSILRWRLIYHSLAVRVRQ